MNWGGEAEPNLSDNSILQHLEGSGYDDDRESKNPYGKKGAGMVGMGSQQYAHAMKGIGFFDMSYNDTANLYGQDTYHNATPVSIYQDGAGMHGEGAKIRAAMEIAKKFLKEFGKRAAAEFKKRLPQLILIAKQQGLASKGAALFADKLGMSGDVKSALVAGVAGATGAGMNGAGASTNTKGHIQPPFKIVNRGGVGNMAVKPWYGEPYVPNVGGVLH